MVTMTKTKTNCEIICFLWTFNFEYSVGRAIHQFKIPTKYLFNLVILHIIWNQRMYVSTKISKVVKPRYLMPSKFIYFHNVFLKQNIILSAQQGTQKTNTKNKTKQPLRCNVLWYLFCLVIKINTRKVE